jgi:futalosine hydrolase
MEVRHVKKCCEMRFGNTIADSSGNYGFLINDNNYVYFATHGVGVMHATKTIMEICHLHKPDLIIQAGIAGSYNKQLALGNVYTVSADRLADVGAQDHENFLSVYDLELEDQTHTPYTNGWLFNTELPYPVFFSGFNPLSSITVNTATGNQATIDLWQNLYKPSLETMEGAALHYVCLTEKIAFVQLRAISNYVTPRNKNTWQIGLAVTNLNDVLISYLKSIAE